MSLYMTVEVCMIKSIGRLSLDLSNEERVLQRREWTIRIGNAFRLLRLDNIITECVSYTLGILRISLSILDVLQHKLILSSPG